MMRIFLAGATGVIGRRLAPMLISGGHGVTPYPIRPMCRAKLRVDC